MGVLGCGLRPAPPTSRVRACGCRGCRATIRPRWARCEPPPPASSGLTLSMSKLSSDGSRLICSTYIGGSAGDLVMRLAVGPEGTLFYFLGHTDSIDFPVTAGVLQTRHAGAGATRFPRPVERGRLRSWFSPPSSAAWASIWPGDWWSRQPGLSSACERNRAASPPSRASRRVPTPEPRISISSRCARTGRRPSHRDLLRRRRR